MQVMREKGSVDCTRFLPARCLSARLCVVPLLCVLYRRYLYELLYLL